MKEDENQGPGEDEGAGRKYIVILVIVKDGEYNQITWNLKLGSNCIRK